MTDLPHLYLTATHAASNARDAVIVAEFHTLKEIVMTGLITGVVSLLAGFGLGWYVKGRGITGVQTDIGNAEKTVSADVKSL